MKHSTVLSGRKRNRKKNEKKKRKKKIVLRSDQKNFAKQTNGGGSNIS